MNLKIESKIDHKTIENKGNTIHYFVSGNENEETIVFLHPAFGDHSCFYKQIDCFSTNYRVITVDMLGHGLTGVGKSKDKITATVVHIAEILKVENRDATHIVVVSVGSLLAQFRRYTGNVSAINELEQIRFYESAKHFTRKSFTVMSGLDKLIANRDVQRNYPLLILSGEKDNELALKMAKQWHEEEQNSKMFIIENAGHCANMDNAKDFNNIVMNFITETK